MYRGMPKAKKKRGRRRRKNKKEEEEEVEDVQGHAKSQESQSHF